MIRATARIALALLLLFLARPGKAQITTPAVKDIVQTAKGVVVAVNFVGNHALSTPELQSVVQTSVPGWFSRTIASLPLLGGLGSTYQDLDFAKLATDTSRLNLHYKDRGYLLARATYTVSPNRDDLRSYLDWVKRTQVYKGVPNTNDAPVLHDTVTFFIEEGPQFTINHVAMAGLDSIPDEFQPELTEHVTIKSGQVWSRALAAKEVERLDSFMLRHGYPYFHFDTIVVENQQPSTKVNVTFYYTPGHRYKYGNMEIVWDSSEPTRQRVADRVIRAQVLTDSGGWYDIDDIQRSEANLYQLNTFEIARVTLDTNYINRIPDSLRDGSAIPVEIFLRMRLTREISPSIYGGQSSQGFVAGAALSYTNRNLSNRADNLAIQTNYQVLPTTQTRYSGNVDYTIPYIGLGRIPLILGLGGTYLKQDSLVTNGTIFHPYTQRSLSAHAGSNIILSKLDNRTKLTPDISFQYDTTFATDSATLLALGAQQLSLIPSLGYQDDRTDDILNPTSGHNFNVVAEWGAPIFSINNIPSAAYIKLDPMYRSYLPLADSGRSTLAGRLHIGATKLFYPDQLTRVPPPERRFYSGGATTVRGWPERGLLVTDNQLIQHADFGGYSILTFNIEWRYQPFHYPAEYTFWQKALSPLRTVLFYDAGNAWASDLSKATFRFSDIAQSIGIGIRYVTLFGPFRFDWGIKLYDPSGRFDHNLDLPIRSTDKGAWIWDAISRGRKFGVDIMTFHFGIGQAF